MKSALTMGLLTAMLFGLPSSSRAADLAEKWTGTFSCKETNFVTVKELTFTKEKDGSIKIRGALVGFPDKVSIGEATAEPYARRNDTNPDTIIATFSSDKFKPMMIIQPACFSDDQVTELVFTCYMKDVDGAKIHINGSLERDK